MNNDQNTPEEPHGSSVPEPHHAVPYFKIFGILVVLTVVTVAASWYRTENELTKVLIALLIASIKASLVALFFMHLKFEGKLIFLILMVPVLLCILLVCALIPDVMHGPLFNILFRK